MSVRWRRGLWWAAAGPCCLVAAMVLAACGGASGEAMAVPGTLRVLQMNLCDSGIATCFTGRSVGEAGSVIRLERPDIVTLNEVCRHDVAVLRQALSGAERGSVVTSAFEPALQQGNGEPFRCRNGEQYGIGLLARVRPPSRGFTTSGGHYPAQDPADTEARAWLCVHAPSHFYACTTHLSNTSRSVAVDQCRYLMHRVFPALRAPDHNDPVILGADLNLLDDQLSNPQSCIPPGFVRTDDGARQDVVASVPVRVTFTRTIDMRGTTDHPGLLADLAVGRRNRNIP